MIVASSVYFFLLRGSQQKLLSENQHVKTSIQSKRAAMRIKIASIFVDDQDKALRYYTEKLGFMKKTDVPVGDYRWLTVVSPDAPEGMELLLEPNVHKAANVI